MACAYRFAGSNRARAMVEAFVRRRRERGQRRDASERARAALGAIDRRRRRLASVELATNRTLPCRRARRRLAARPAARSSAPEGVYRPPAARPAQAPPARGPRRRRPLEQLGQAAGAARRRRRQKRPRPDEPDGRPVKPAKPAKPPKPAHLSARVPMPPAAPVLAPPPALLTRELALDCEMVGVGASGTRSALAQVVICNAHEQVVYSTFVKPVDRVTDFRTHVSGVRSAHMARARSRSSSCRARWRGCWTAASSWATRSRTT